MDQPVPPSRLTQQVSTRRACPRCVRGLMLFDRIDGPHYECINCAHVEWVNPQRPWSREDDLALSLGSGRRLSGPRTPGMQDVPL